MSIYEKNKQIAIDNGWNISHGEVDNISANTWMCYWDQMKTRDEKVAAGDKNPGRPVLPHKPGQGIV